MTQNNNTLSCICENAKLYVSYLYHIKRKKNIK